MRPADCGYCGQPLDTTEREHCGRCGHLIPDAEQPHWGPDVSGQCG